MKVLFRGEKENQKRRSKDRLLDLLDGDGGARPY
jgi:hypothetical protein